MSDNEKWIKHLRKLATDNANLRVTVRGLRLEVTALQDDVDHYKREFARQNARILTMAIQSEVETPVKLKIDENKCQDVKSHDSMLAVQECGNSHDGAGSA